MPHLIKAQNFDFPCAKVDHRDACRFGVMPHFLLEGSSRLPTAAGDQCDMPICGHGSLVEVARGEEIGNSIHHQRIVSMIRKVECGGMGWCEMALLQQKFHNQISAVIPPIESDRIDICDIVIKA